MILLGCWLKFSDKVLLTLPSGLTVECAKLLGLYKAVLRSMHKSFNELAVVSISFIVFNKYLQYVDFTISQPETHVFLIGFRKVLSTAEKRFKKSILRIPRLHDYKDSTLYAT